ncbi:hypothetical protein A8O14_07945 [Polynucleobacter wuianus]|uniref:Histidine kinase/HSP90-like ATPase domain-containing protein n=2 Tax=Burkholderiaceae TaxID=119060 RepID=A0A191UG66_9BURK|nr:hypothetical protein A8O14_07945 [Polynucleobacter wuianus]MBU3552841.1 histidine kinase [Polynucleobacter sp. MWH-Post4-6-1]
MIFKILSKGDLNIALPQSFNKDTMIDFIENLIDGNKNAKGAKIYFDFSALEFIEPEGIVTLSNLIEYFKLQRLNIYFKNHKHGSGALRFLDDAGFFKYYLKQNIFEGSKVRDTTIPLHILPEEKQQSYLLNTLIPWIGERANIGGDPLDLIRVHLEEIFHNIIFHSGVKIGCFFAQHFPRKNQISIAIADFGHGIPENVRTIYPSMSDKDALKQAVEEGFTTQSNVRNRGAGLTMLVKFVAQKNDGVVLIHSGMGYLSATMGPKAPNITSRSIPKGYYPGTMVQVLLRTDTMKMTESSLEKEEFQW